MSLPKSISEYRLALKAAEAKNVRLDAVQLEGFCQESAPGSCHRHHGFTVENDEMSDLIDVLSATGLRTGEILSRAEVHRLGKHHRAVHLYIFNSRNEVLLQRRSLTVDHFPGRFGISVTGHVSAGEYSADTVRREVQEELGMDGSRLKIDFLFSFYQEAVLNETYIDRQFNDVYVTGADVDPASIDFDRSEVTEVRFVPFDSFRRMVENGGDGLAPVYANECKDLVYFLRGWSTPMGSARRPAG
jgi:isopentenyldiphosphate isomerase